MAKIGYIGRDPASSSVVVAKQFLTATGSVGLVTFNSGYTPGYLDVFLNGVKLQDAVDYSAGDGRVINFTTNASEGDVIEMVAYKALTLGSSNIGITSAGKDYTIAPALIVIDGFTGKPVLDLDLAYELGNPNVEILQNTFGMHDAPPTVVPIHNSNGVGISTIGFNTTTKDVTVTMQVGYSTADTFPFSVGELIFIEGIAVGVGSTGRGYNSAEYDYKLFNITNIHENYGGIGSITYNLTDFFGDLAPELTPGQERSLKNAIKKQKELQDGKSKKVKLTKAEKASVKSVEDSGAYQVEVGTSSREQTQVVVYPRITDSMVESSKDWSKRDLYPYRRNSGRQYNKGSARLSLRFFKGCRKV